MSDNPIPVTEDRTPFVAVSTPAIERANRLMGVRAHQGFPDLVRISQAILQEARENTEDYPGWDPQVITVLKVRQQVAKEYHQRWLEKINTAIEEGIAEAREQSQAAGEAAAKNPEQSADDSVDQGDFVRQEVLKSFKELDTRVPGSYDPNPEPVNYDWK